MVVVVPSPTDDGSIDAANLGKVLWNARLWPVVLALALGALALVHVLVATRLYRAEVLVVPASTGTGGSTGMLGGQLGALASLAGIDSSAMAGRRAEYIALLSSKALLRQFIERNDLMPVLFAKRWDAAKGRWKESNSRAVPRLGDGVDLFTGKILNVVPGKDGLIRVGTEWSDPVLAARWANDLVKSVNEYVRAQTIQDAKRGMEFLDRELQTATTIEVRQGIYRLQEANLNKVMLANVQDDYALRIIDSAVVPLHPVWPRPVFEIAFGIMAGLAIGIAWPLWRDRKQWWMPGPSTAGRP